MSKYFSSDWHLGHKRVLDFGHRPFKTVEEMDNTIIENMISPLKEGDILYFLGDLYWDKRSFWKFYNKIPKGVEFRWILGNHDMKQAKQHTLQFKTITPMEECRIEKIPVTMCHYPMALWNKSHYGSFQLYGHVHLGSHHVFEPVGKQMNVNCELHDYKPWTEKEILEHMSKRPDNEDFIP